MKLVWKYIKYIISLPYQLLHELRKLLYSSGILRVRKLDAFVISVGNLSFGGTGKTPVTVELAKYLSKETGKRIAILTRAYKSDPELTSGKTLLLNQEGLWDLAEGKKPNLKSKIEDVSAHGVGDEPYMMNLLLHTELFGSVTDLQVEGEQAEAQIDIVIDSNRYRGGLRAQELGAEILILDDGRQHLQLARDFEILLKNINESGFFRELPGNYTQADLLIHTKVNEAWIAKNPDKFAVQNKISLMKLLTPNKGVLVFSGIADPESFLGDLTSYFEASKSPLATPPGLGDGGQITHKFYPDHHSFSDKEVRDLISKGTNLVCTLKDYVKVPRCYQGEIIPAGIELEVSHSDCFKQIVGKLKNART